MESGVSKPNRGRSRASLCGLLAFLVVVLPVWPILLQALSRLQAGRLKWWFVRLEWTLWDYIFQAIPGAIAGAMGLMVALRVRRVVFEMINERADSRKG